MSLEELKEHIRALSEQVRQQVGGKISGLLIIDTIFFPGHDHAPMIRVDGGSLKEKEMAHIDSSDERLFVRIPELAGLHPSDFYRKVLNKYPEASVRLVAEAKYGRELESAIRNGLKGRVNDIDELFLWEVDVDGRGNIAVRFIGIDERAEHREPIGFGSLRVEFVSEISSNEGRAMLHVFDESKRVGRPYMQYVGEIQL
ncbi:hypothetical protein JW899_02475 [Candidatus Uhrbacteria bacterium]|nr:hypothetical protein [Candidatus Uhrbacteria bacterium]